MFSRVLAALSLALFMLGANIAHAHDPIFYYPVWWGVDKTVPFYISDHDFDLGKYPGPTGANRVFNGITVWNAQNQALKFSNGGQDYNLNWDAVCSSATPFQRDGLFWMPIDGPPSSAGSTLAEARVCVKTNGTGEFGGEIVQARIRFDSADPWYTGTGPTPLGLFDLFGVATHEAGHAAGHWYHWDDPGSDATVCLPPWPKHTMCASVQHPGSEDRSLELHDYHTFNVAY